MMKITRFPVGHQKSRNLVEAEEEKPFHTSKIAHWKIGNN